MIGGSNKEACGFFGFFDTETTNTVLGKPKNSLLEGKYHPFNAKFQGFIAMQCVREALCEIGKAECTGDRLGELAIFKRKIFGEGVEGKFDFYTFLYRVDTEDSNTITELMKVLLTLGRMIKDPRETRGIPFYLDSLTERN